MNAGGRGGEGLGGLFGHGFAAGAAAAALGVVAAHVPDHDLLRRLARLHFRVEIVQRHESFEIVRIAFDRHEEGFAVLGEDVPTEVDDDAILGAARFKELLVGAGEDFAHGQAHVRAGGRIGEQVDLIAGNAPLGGEAVGGGFGLIGAVNLAVDLRVRERVEVEVVADVDEEQSAGELVAVGERAWAFGWHSEFRLFRFVRSTGLFGYGLARELFRAVNSAEHEASREDQGHADPDVLRVVRSASILPLSAVRTHRLGRLESGDGRDGDRRRTRTLRRRRRRVGRRFVSHRLRIARRHRIRVTRRRAVTHRRRGWVSGRRWIGIARRRRVRIARRRRVRIVTLRRIALVNRRGVRFAFKRILAGRRTGRAEFLKWRTACGNEVVRVAVLFRVVQRKWFGSSRHRSHARAALLALHDLPGPRRGNPQRRLAVRARGADRCCVHSVVSTRCHLIRPNSSPSSSENAPRFIREANSWLAIVQQEQRQAASHPGSSSCRSY